MYVNLKGKKQEVLVIAKSMIGHLVEYFTLKFIVLFYAGFAKVFVELFFLLQSSSKLA